MNRKNVDKYKLEKYTSIVSNMVSTKTVYSLYDSCKDEFKKFYKVVEESFPLISNKCNRLEFGTGCFVYELKGNNAKKNIMLMSHHDVVDATSGWNTDPFKAIIIDNKLYGRGSIDTKTPLFAIMMALEELLTENYDLSNLNIYIGSSNNEEVAGDGMPMAVKYFKEHNIHFDLVLDEGGAILENMIPGYTGKSAMVALHEKSRHLYKCSVSNKNKGHTGLNGKSDSPVNRLTRFINEVNNTKIYKAKFYPLVKETFKSHVPYMKGPMKFVFKNLTLFSPIVKKIMLNIPSASQMLSTSISFNNLNVNNNSGSCDMMIRCIIEDDMLKGYEEINSIAAKYDVNITLVERDYCRPSDYNSDYFKLVKKVLNNNFPDVTVAPFLLTAGTDARRFSDIADNIVRFAPIDLNKEQFAAIHGDNEYIKVENIGECVCFYEDILKELTK